MAVSSSDHQMVGTRGLVRLERFLPKARLRDGAWSVILSVLYWQDGRGSIDSRLLASQLGGGTQCSTPKFWSLTFFFPITHEEAWSPQAGVSLVQDPNSSLTKLDPCLVSVRAM